MEGKEGSRQGQKEFGKEARGEKKGGGMRQEDRKGNESRHKRAK